MRILKAFGAKSLAVALALSMAPVAVPAGTPLLGASKAKAQDFFVGGPRHWRGDRGHWRGDRGRWRDWDRPRYRHRDRGDAAAAAIVGGIVGLGIGAALASPRYYEPAPRYYEPAPRYYERRVYRPKPVYRAAPRCATTRQMSCAPGRANGTTTAPPAIVPSIRARARSSPITARGSSAAEPPEAAQLPPSGLVASASHATASGVRSGPISSRTRAW